MSYVGHDSSRFSGIYDLCLRFAPESGSILDLGSRHGEGFDLFGRTREGTYTMVEPSPRCIPIIRKRMLDGGEWNRVSLIPGILGSGSGTVSLHVLSSDDDQSGNLFSDRGGKYGQEDVVDVPVIPFSCAPSQVDFAKINIEGGEYSLIEDSYQEFFLRIGSFVMEAHNQHVPNRTYRDIIERLEGDYDLTTMGNLDYKYSFVIGRKIP